MKLILRYHFSSLNLYRQCVFRRGNKLEFDNKKNYKDVFVTIKLSAESNKTLTESSMRSHRKKLQEAKLRLEDHLMRFGSISEKGKANMKDNEDMSNSLFIENVIKFRSTK